MPVSDDLLKDMLFQDEVFWKVVDTLGPKPVYSRVEDFIGDLTFQIKNLQGTEKWRRSVTALIIRGKNRLRELEKNEYDSSIKGGFRL